MGLVHASKFTKNLVLICQCHLTQGRSEGISSVAFEVLIINCQIYFINLFIFNCLTLNINCSSSSSLMSNFCFPKIMSFTNRRERLFMDLWMCVFSSDFKLTQENMTCYLRDINKFLKYRTLCKSILKYGLLTKGIGLTWFVPFEVLRVPQL